MKRGFLLIIFVIIISAFCACDSVSNSIDSSAVSAYTSTKHTSSTINDKSRVAQNTEKSGVKSSEEKNEWNKVGKSVTIKGLQFTINAYKKTDKSELFKAAKGKTFLLIDITVKNTLKEKATVSSESMFELSDFYGTLYNDISFGALSCLEDENLEELDGEVAALSEFRGGLAYEIPKVTQGLRLVVHQPLGDGRSPVQLY